MRPHTKMQLSPGVFFSPGYYMGYWRTCIEANFSEETIWGHTKLQKHREMYAGAIMAAIQTKTTCIQHFVGLPDDEPSDVDVVKLVVRTMPSGRKANTLKRLNVQITECDFDRGETFIKQFENKNKQAYADIIIGVYVKGRTTTSNFDEDRSELHKLGKIYPSFVCTIEPVDYANGIRQTPGTFGMTEIYPRKGAEIINIDDQEAFFLEPAVFTKTSRKVTTEWEDKGSFELLTPVL